ncbi:MAG: nickel/cobalt efflux protein RcnA [Verrucomicrobiaceae bacterium]|nr:nickel/cobalt efflux protein RcnA [Verrucomicrobiaceae bacterium]
MNSASFADYLNSGHAWLYVPVAILLGALHGLEPGHSKTMMAAFIIAVRGTIMQAVLLGLSAALSHSLIIWILAALALHYGNRWDAETVEPYLQLGSAVLIFGLAFWMFLRTRREVREADEHHHDHAQEGPPGPAQPLHEMELPAGLTAPVRVARRAAGPRRGPHGGLLLDTGHGWLEIAVVGEGGSARFRIFPCTAAGGPQPVARGTRLSIETVRLDGSSQNFKFEDGGTFWESTAIVPAPHEFLAVVTMGHAGHEHVFRLQFGDHTGPRHPVLAAEEIHLEGSTVYQDAHERYHAEDIARRFTNRTVTTPQIIMFGITGGLMPCPAAFTILLVCLQLKRATLGFAIVGAFSFGLALTMVTVGAAAAWSVQHAQKRFSGFGEAMRRAPYVSCALLMLLALYMGWHGWTALAGHPA